MENDAMTFNLASAVHRHSQATPQAFALSFEGSYLTYGQLAAQAAGLAECLKNSPGWTGKNGAQPRVGILASRSADACIALLGASWAGATYVPLGLKLPEERLLTILSLCNLSAIVADAQGARLLSEKVLQAGPPLVCVLGAAPPVAPSGPPDDGRIAWLDPQALAASAPGQSQPAHVKATDTAYIIFTSGTTGIPKGVMIAAGAIRHYVETVTAMLGLRETDRALETCELTFDVSLHNMFCTWEAGASLHVLPAARVMNAVKFARENALTVWNSVPSLVGMLRQVKALGPSALPGLRLTVFGGEQLSKGAVEAWKAAAPASTIHNFYGPTEVTVYCLSQLLAEPTPLTPGRDVVAIGTALPGSEAAVLDAAGNPVADNCVGELALAGVQLAIGYLNAPELTNARFATFAGKRWYLTGDLAMRDATGTFHWLGRMDNQVKVMGHRVELEEIDAHLRVVADADMVASVPWPMVEGAAQGLVAFVGASIIDDAQISRALKARLPHYMIPSRIFAIEDMPLNSNGKVDRKALRQRLESGME
ncbi:amino acid adenylation domain-containing protein [Noviherbaspirillum sedimenti]|nr:amino acid adenylation domain-containing protein [Noviherbaspirillum sedimenti]